MKKYILIPISLFLGVFSLASNALASSPYDQNAQTTNYTDSLSIQLYNGPGGGAPGTAFDIDQVDLYMTLDNSTCTSGGHITGGEIRLDLSSYAGGFGVSATTTAISGSGIYHFVLPTTFHSDGHSLFQIANGYGPTCSTSLGGTNIFNFDGVASATYWFPFSSSHFPKIILNNSLPPASYGIQFNTASFPDNLQTPDFLNWNVCFYSPGSFSGNASIKYGTSSPTSITDSLAGQLGVSNVPLANGDCLIIGKNATSTAGSYVAQAFLYDSGGSTIATSTILNFTITNGTPVSYPNQTPPYTAPSTCGQTSFSVLGADFGEGFCKLTKFLFVPDQSTLNQWTNTQTKMQSRAPFSYFYQLTTAMNTLPTSTSATITPLTLDVASGTPMHLTIDIFSASTINKFTSPTARSVVRTLIQYSLYLAFIAMVILEIRHLFSKEKPKQ